MKHKLDLKSGNGGFFKAPTVTISTVSMPEIPGYDLDVLTDEQSADAVPNPKGLGYVINVASDKNGVGYGAWNRVDGFSEACVDYIQESEKQAAETGQAGQ